jgi:hypothetical protein
MESASVNGSDKVRITVRLPKAIYDEARNLIEANVVPVDSLNDFLVTAIAAYVKLVKRKQVDAAFSGMASDPEYQKESRLISDEFAQSDWEALEIAEGNQT